METPEELFAEFGELEQFNLSEAELVELDDWRRAIDRERAFRAEGLAQGQAKVARLQQLNCLRLVLTYKQLPLLLIFLLNKLRN